MIFAGELSYFVNRMGAPISSLGGRCLSPLLYFWLLDSQMSDVRYETVGKWGEIKSWGRVHAPFDLAGRQRCVMGCLHSHQLRLHFP